MKLPMATSTSAAAITRYCKDENDANQRPALSEEALGAVHDSALALRLLPTANRDLALDDLLDHTAAWAVGQALSSDANGAAVQAFLTYCI